MTTANKNKVISLILIAFIGGALLYTLRSLGSWYIDDAAISLAYARNFMRGLGFVAQVGDCPVEGFSNPLMVLIEACVMKLFGYISLSIPRGITCLLFVILVCHIFFKYRGNPYLANKWYLSILLVILQPAVSIWSLSGLENGLLVFLLFELLIQLTEKDNGNPWKISLISTALALTRPDAILFTLAYPITVCLKNYKQHQIPIMSILKSFVIVGIVYGGYLLFRISYFGSIVPNTYYAKALPTFVSVKELLILGPEMRNRIFSALFAFWGTATPWILLTVAFVLYIKREHIRSWLCDNIALFVVFGISLFIYAYLPNDWMPYHRFATAFFVSGYVLFTFSILQRTPTIQRLFCIVAILCICVSNFILGTKGFLNIKPIEVFHVQARGDYFYRWGQYLGIEKPLLMTADAGGILWDEKVRLLDLGMLCDSTIARCLGEYHSLPNHEKFYEYVLNERKPDFIATRAYHSYIARLELDKRFISDYVPIHQYIDTWILNRYNCTMHSGDYVRRDLIIGKEQIFKKIQEESQAIYYPFDYKLIRQKE